MKLPRLEAGDFWGGIAAMLVALPSAIAFGVTIYFPLGASHVAQGALAGILGATALGLIAPAQGGTKRLITAPCAPAAAVLAAFSLDFMQRGGDFATALLLLSLLGLAAGLLQIAFGTVRLGRLIVYMPYPVVSGYLSGVGLYIIAGQVPKFLGLPKDVHFWQALTGRPALHQGGGFADALAGRWQALGGIGLGEIGQIAVPALTLAVLLSIDTLKTCVVLDALTRSRHNSNRELIGQGLGNMASAMVGGIPGAGTMGATLVNISSGGQTWLSGLLEGVFALLAFDLFKNRKAQTLTALEQCMEKRFYRAGEKIFSRGDGGDELFIIRRGAVRIMLPITDKLGHHLGTFSRGAFFGEMTFLDGEPRSADAIAHADTDLFVLSRQRFNQVAEEHKKLALGLMEGLASVLSSRLRYTNAELRVLEA